MDRIPQNPMDNSLKIDSAEKRAVRDAVRAKFNAISSRVTKRAEETKNMDELSKLSGEVLVFVNSLKAKYPNAKEYMIMHSLFGSGYGSIFSDFPGEDSVEKFVNGLEQRYP